MPTSWKGEVGSCTAACVWQEGALPVAPAPALALGWCWAVVQGHEPSAAFLELLFGAVPLQQDRLLLEAAEGGDLAL